MTDKNVKKNLVFPDLFIYKIFYVIRKKNNITKNVI